MTMVPIASIRKDGGTQPRAALNFEVIEEYVEAMQAGAKFPPVDVFYDGTDYWLADGFHRVEAAFGAGFDSIDAAVHQGTVQDAQWFSFGANKANGLYRSNADKQRAVQSALKHPMSSRLSDREIAKHVGVSYETVRGWRGKLGDIYQTLTDTRTATRNGKQYQIDTTNIGKRSAQRVNPDPVEPTKTPGQSIITGVKQATDWAEGKTLAPIACKETVVVVQQPDPTEPTLESQWVDWLISTARQIAECPVDERKLAAELSTRSASELLALEKASDFIAYVTEQSQRPSPAA
jgi:hypothetical protein